MPLDTHRFAQLRPYLYHLTAGRNVASIRRLREIRCARVLLDSASLSSLAPRRRLSHLSVQIDGEAVIIRDQKPLTAGAIAFEAGWDLERFVRHVNEHVFFWPGGPTGPIKAGLNHFERYKSECLSILRVPTRDFAPPAAAFCRYNSGAPRCSAGKYSPRGAETYLDASRFGGRPSDVVEVVAINTCPVPQSAEVAATLDGPWLPLYGVA